MEERLFVFPPFPPGGSGERDILGRETRDVMGMFIFIFQFIFNY